MDVVRMAGCVLAVSDSASAGPVEAQAAQRLAQRSVGFFEHRPR
jgi:hypothetical protein